MESYGRTAGGRWELSLYCTPSIRRFGVLRGRVDVVKSYLDVELALEKQDLGKAVGHEL